MGRKWKGRRSRVTYKIVDREIHNHTWDLLHVEIQYPNRNGEKGRHILNRYKVLKHENRVPTELMAERKYDTQPLDGIEWKEGKMTRKDFANRRRDSDDVQG